MTELLNVCLLAFMAVVALVVLRLRNLFAAAMVASFFSLLSAGMFVDSRRRRRRLHRGRRRRPG